MIKRFISINEAKGRVLLCLTASYQVYCNQCKIFNVIPLKFEAYLEDVRFVVLKLSKEVK